MSQPIQLPKDKNIPPCQVWQRLAVDRQFQITRLLTQLALNLVVAQAEPLSSLPEVTYALSTQPTKDQV